MKHSFEFMIWLLKPFIILGEIQSKSSQNFMLIKRSGIRYPVSGIRYPVAGIRYPVSGIRYPVAGIRYPVSGIRYPVSGIR